MGVTPGIVMGGSPRAQMCIGVVAGVAIREHVEIVQRLNVGAKDWQLHEFHFFFLAC